MDAIGVRMTPGADLDAVREIASAAGATAYAGKDRGTVEQSENQDTLLLVPTDGGASIRAFSGSMIRYGPACSWQPVRR